MTTDENGENFELKSRFYAKENGCPAKMGKFGDFMSPISGEQ